MKDTDIIFSQPMVAAQRQGRKNMTRRYAWIGTPDGVEARPSKWQKCAAGDRIWVRESFWRYGIWRQVKGRWKFFPYTPRKASKIIYDDGQPVERIPRNEMGYHKIPSIHMPRLASRIYWTVTAVKIEPLNDMSSADALAEGIFRCEPSRMPLPGVTWYSYAPGSGQAVASPVGAFRALWEKLHGAGTWAENPEVVAIKGKVHFCNIQTGVKL